jgi:hypothetical protein
VQDGSIVCWGWDLSTSPATFSASAIAVPGW